MSELNENGGEGSNNSTPTKQAPAEGSGILHPVQRPEQRLITLFDFKAKWTYEELRVYMEDFIEKGADVENFLMKNTRMVKEKNPFNEEKEVNYYIKKF